MSCHPAMSNGSAQPPSRSSAGSLLTSDDAMVDSLVFAESQKVPACDLEMYDQTEYLVGLLVSADRNRVQFAAQRLYELTLAGLADLPFLDHSLTFLFRIFYDPQRDTHKWARKLLQQMCFDASTAARIAAHHPHDGLEILVELLESPPHFLVVDVVVRAILQRLSVTHVLCQFSKIMPVSSSDATSSSLSSSSVGELVIALRQVVCGEDNGPKAHNVQSGQQRKGMLRIRKSIWDAPGSESTIKESEGHTGEESMVLQLLLRGSVSPSAKGQGAVEFLMEPDEVLYWLLLTVFKLCCIEAYRQTLVRSGAIEASTRALKTTSLDTRMLAIQTLHVLMVHNSIEFVACNGVKLLANTLKLSAEPGSQLHPDEVATVLELCLKLFHLHGDIRTIAAQMVHSHVLDVAMVSLLEFSDLAVQWNALRLVAKLLQEGPPTNAMVLSSNRKVFPALIHHLKCDDPSIQTLAAAVLWQLCIHCSDESVDRIVFHGGIPLLRRLIKSTDRTLRHNAFGVLRCLDCFDDLDFDPLP